MSKASERGESSMDCTRKYNTVFVSRIGSLHTYVFIA